MSANIWENDAPGVSTTIPTDIQNAVVVRISLGAASGSRRYPNRINMQMDGYYSITGRDSADCLEQIKNYIIDPGNRTLKPRSLRDPATVGGREPTDMSLKFNKRCYLVIHLDDRLGWLFARDYRPFSRPIAEVYKNVFKDQHLFDSSGSPTPVAGDGQGAKVGCRFAMMTFDPTAIGEARSDGGFENFVARFNINLELLDDPGSTDAYIPIIVDPDVRWPGGDGP